MKRDTYYGNGVVAKATALREKKPTGKSYPAGSDA